MTPVTLDRFLVEARRMLAEPEKHRLPPRVLAHADQIKARDVPYHRVLVGHGFSRSPARNEVRTTALMLAIGAAGQRTRPRLCTHIDRGTSPLMQDCNVDLTLGFVACHACTPATYAAFLAMHGTGELVTPDDRCDLCDVPSTHFREVLVTLVARMHMNVCDACFGWIHEDAA